MSFFGKGHDSDDDTGGSWSQWARFVLNEQKRVGSGVRDLEQQLKQLAGNVSDVQKEMIDTKYSVATNLHEIEEIHKSIIELRNDVNDYREFRTKVKVVMAGMSFVFTAGVTLISFLL